MKKMDENQISAAVINFVKSRSGVSLREIQLELKANPALVGKVVYALAASEDIVLEEGDDDEGTHWFFMPVSTRKYTLAMYGRSDVPRVVKTDSLSTLMSYVRSAIETGTVALDITTDPHDFRATSRSNEAQDLDTLSSKEDTVYTIRKGSLAVESRVHPSDEKRKFCDCPSNLHDCKNFHCPRA